MNGAGRMQPGACELALCWRDGVAWLAAEKARSPGVLCLLYWCRGGQDLLDEQTPSFGDQDAGNGDQL